MDGAPIGDPGKRPGAESSAAALAELAMARRNRFRGLTPWQYLAGLDGSVLQTTRQRLADLTGGRE